MEKLEQKVYAIKEQAKDAANVATAKTKKSADKVHLRICSLPSCSALFS